MVMMTVNTSKASWRIKQLHTSQSNKYLASTPGSKHSRDVSYQEIIWHNHQHTGPAQLNVIPLPSSPATQIFSIRKQCLQLYLCYGLFLQNGGSTNPSFSYQSSVCISTSHTHTHTRTQVWEAYNSPQSSKCLAVNVNEENDWERGCGG